METASIYLKEQTVNATEHYRFGDDGWFESRFTERGEAYRGMQSEHGRCTGKMYMDGPDGQPHHVGWVFVKRRKYDDCAQTFLAETWVTVRKGAPEPHCTHCGTVHGSGRGVTVVQ